MLIEKNEKILFTGDSITDYGRDRNDIHGLTAYSKMISEYINIFNPELNVKVYNKGISGNTTKMLNERMENDLEEIKPSAVSILIGVNDCWSRYKRNVITTAEQFINSYKELIDKTKKYTSKIIVLEPFLIPADPEKDHYREDLDPKINALRKLCKAENLEFIPLDGIFAEKSITGNAADYADDGVHPTIEGYKVITAEWIKRTNLLKTV